MLVYNSIETLVIIYIIINLKIIFCCYKCCSVFLSLTFSRVNARNFTRRTYNAVARRTCNACYNPRLQHLNREHNGFIYRIVY